MICITKVSINRVEGYYHIYISYHVVTWYISIWGFGTEMEITEKMKTTTDNERDEAIKKKHLQV